MTVVSVDCPSKTNHWNKTKEEWEHNHKSGPVWPQWSLWTSTINDECSCFEVAIKAHYSHHDKVQPSILSTTSCYQFLIYQLPRPKKNNRYLGMIVYNPYHIVAILVDITKVDTCHKINISANVHIYYVDAKDQD